MTSESEELEQPRLAGRMPMVMQLEAGTYYWCACGRSSEQPFCDGSHAGTCFEPLRFELEAPRRVALCTCKRSARSPFCDGTHSRLPL
jgi:CDGSH-type Zn-finger protein